MSALRFVAVVLGVFAFFGAYIGESQALIRDKRAARLAKNKRKETRDLNSSCPNGIQAVKFGILWKPAADSTDSRRGKPVILLTGSNKLSAKKKGKPKTVKIFSSAGDQICSLAFKAPNVPGTNSGADHYWSGWPGGCKKTASKMAKLSPGGKIYVEWKGGKCIGPINPKLRTGRIA